MRGRGILSLLCLSLLGIDQQASAQIVVAGCCGGSSVCEGTVAKGLKWLAAQQQSDGSWTASRELAADEEQPIDQAATRNTAIVLLAYLGAGQTHREGTYKQPINAGVQFLVLQMAESGELGDLRGAGDMSAHGIAALALTEAYAMTHDKQLIVPAQLAVRFSERSQNRITGGWGLQPQERDDLHIAGWQWLVLRSAKFGSLLVANEPHERSQRYLNTQRAANEKHYYGRYMPGYDVQATAIGLVGRVAVNDIDDDMQWHEAAQWAAATGPARHDVERNFWVTQVARQTGGDAWRRWSDQLRTLLVKQQAGDGPERGSWFDAEDLAADQGRIYQTALNTMCLEVYYRHLPVYRDFLLKPVAKDKEVDDPFAAPEPAPGVLEEIEDLFGEPADEDPFG